MNEIIGTTFGLFLIYIGMIIIMDVFFRKFEIRKKEENELLPKLIENKRIDILV